MPTPPSNTLPRQSHVIEDFDKRRKYKTRVIEVEHGTFTPFVMSTSGGMGPSAIVTIKRLVRLAGDVFEIYHHTRSACHIRLRDLESRAKQL